MSAFGNILFTLAILVSGLGKTEQQKEHGPRTDDVNYWCQEEERITFDFGVNTIFQDNCSTIVVSHPFGDGCRISSFGDIDISWTYNDNTSFKGAVYLPDGDSQTTITFASKEKEKSYRLFSSEKIGGGWAVSALSLDDARMLAANLENQVLMDGDKPISSKPKALLEAGNKAGGYLVYSGTVFGNGKLE